MKPIRFRYPGGKGILAPWIVEHFPKSGRIYLEPFAGRGNVFFRAGQVLDFQQWHLNDLFTAPFFTAMKKELFRIECELPSIEQFRDHQKRFKQGDPLSILLEPYLSFSGGGYAKAGPNRAIRYPDKVGTPEGYSSAVHRGGNLLRELDAKVTKLHWEELPWGELTTEDFVYFDPPYIGCSVRGYTDGFDYASFVKLLTNATFPWVLSEYESDIYDALGEPIARRECKLMVNDQSRATGSRVECLWSNFDLIEGSEQANP